MRTETSAPRNGVAVAHGYGIKIRVDRGHLLVEDGIGRKRQTRRFSRATSGLKRVLVIGHTGYVTFEAARWLRDTGAAYAQLDTAGDVLLVSPTQPANYPALRRAQAFAPGNETGLALARELLTEKIEGQRSLADTLGETPTARLALDQARDAVAKATSVEQLVAAEAEAASAYWAAWRGVAVPFSLRAAAEVPGHWLTFGQRHSTLTSSPRRAINPANAVLNYLYALLEIETTLACIAVGLDPGLGIFHTDRHDRDSLALDVMEACRPLVDSYLLTLLRHRTLARRDFIETRTGDCRIQPTLATRLAETAVTWRNYVSPVAERVAQRIGDRAARPFAVPTRLTGTNRRAAWSAQRGTAARKKAPLPVLPATCRGCGAGLPNRRRRYCDNCRRASAERAGQTGRAAAAVALTRLRDEGRDPAHGGDAAARRGRANAAHQRAIAAWMADGAGNADRAIFEVEIAPQLRERTIAELVAATGLSAHYCSLIRLGKRVPHARHWEVLRSAPH